MHVPPPTLPGEVAATLSVIAERQFGIVTRADLARAGVSRHVVAAQLVAQRWRALGATVIALHNGPLSRVQQWSAAVLAAEGPVGLAGRTAAQAAGLTGWEVEPVHIVVVRGAKVNSLEGVRVKVHESRRFAAEDLHPTRTPPQVRTERAVIDAAVWSVSPRTACGLVAAGVQQRRTTPERLRDVLEGAGKVRHRPLLAAVLTDIEGGAQAMSEVDFLRFCRRNGFPRPELQVRVDTRGKRRYLDATFLRRDGRLVGVEVDGALHLVVTTYWDDMSRGNDLVIRGRRTLRFPSAYIYANDPVMLEQLRALLLLPPLSEPAPVQTGGGSDRSERAS